MDRLQQLMDLRRPWAEKEFKGQTIDGILSHLKAEVKELIKNPEDEEEAFDILLLLIGYCDRVGMTARELIDGGFRKLKICKGRTWQKRNSQGFSQHIDQPTNDKEVGK